MNLEKLEKILLLKTASLKEFPFGDDVMVFKVMNKMFALIASKDDVLRVTLKADSNDAIAYREIYSCVTAGYHMNKKYWNTIVIDGTMEDEILIDMIDESYNLVVTKLTKLERNKLSLYDCN